MKQFTSEWHLSQMDKALALAEKRKSVGNIESYYLFRELARFHSRKAMRALLIPDDAYESREADGGEVPY